MDKNNIVENLIKTIISLCETFDIADCQKCSLYSKCLGQKGNTMLDVLQRFVKKE